MKRVIDINIREWLGEDNQLGVDIWERKYRHNGESFDEWLDRVSDGYDGIRELIAKRKFLPGGRIMSNIGIDDDKSSMMNCYSRGFILDDYNDIMQAAMDIGKTFKAQGGQGLSLSKLRPKGTPIGKHFESDGIIPFMKIFNEVTEGTSQGGSRKGALLISLDAWHAEAMNFITIKSEAGLIEKANISLEIDDEFMRCVERYYNTGEELTITQCRNYSGHEIEYDVTPIRVFKAMVHNNYDWGDPGCLFVNRFRNYNIMEFVDDYRIETCNPCGEQPLPKNMACCLSSINLSEFVIDPYSDHAEFDIEGFKYAIRQGVTYLDHIVDINASRHPLEEQRKNSLDYRNIGLGVFGYGTMLMKMGMKYGSGDAKAFTDVIFDTLFREAVMTSSTLAATYGTFPKYSEKVWESSIIQNHFSEMEIDDMRKNGLRNCSLISVAPTGSLSSMLGESGGCEPEFAISYTRRTVGLTDNEDHYYKVYCKPAREYMKMHGVENEEDLPEWFIGSSDIDPMDRVDTQSIMQNHVDTAISSTVNLPEEATEEQMEQIYLYAWKMGLKGLTIFRNNCKKLGILTSGDFSSDESSESDTQCELSRGYVIPAKDNLIGLKRKLMTGCGSLHCMAYFDVDTLDLRETYLSKGSTGGCNNFMIGLSRLVSLSARAGVPLDVIVDQLESTGVCPSYATRRATKGDTSPGSCCPMAVGKALIEMQKDLKNSLGENQLFKETEEDTVDAPCTECSGATCPECGDQLIFEGGCNICKNCGWSKCS